MTDTPKEVKEQNADPLGSSAATGYATPSFELVQVDEVRDWAEVVIRDRNNKVVYAGNLEKVDNPGAYAPPGYWDK